MIYTWVRNRKSGDTTSRITLDGGDFFYIGTYTDMGVADYNQLRGAYVFEPGQIAVNPANFSFPLVPDHPFLNGGFVPGLEPDNFSMGFISWDGEAPEPPRPTGFASVLWRSPVQPTNWLSNFDYWSDTSATI